MHTMVAATERKGTNMSEAMSSIVLLIGLVIAAIGLAGVASPNSAIRKIQSWSRGSRFAYAVGIRLLLGVVLIVAAPSTRFPKVVLALGIIAVGAALALLLVGKDRLDSLMQWWFNRSHVTQRLSFFVAGVFGVFLIYCAT